MGRLARDAKSRITFVYGPDGATLTLPDLPAPETRRWVSRRKAQIVAAVQGGLLSLDEACERYALSIEEYLGWQHAMERYGVSGLRATHAQEFRHREERCAMH
ncbi:MAG TPA: DUF1153 domain-containing protein [Rhizomicrobium sp.]|jgi:hypothetical protein|nr:DUF1153 domain-containing protein [Rhizomicrobium sp.]